MFTTMGFWGFLGIVVALAVMVWVLYLCLGWLSPKKRTRGAKGCVMVVEDESDVRENIRGQLEGAGYDVIEAEDGEKAIEAMGSGENSFEVDVIITDIPKSKGLEAITYFKKNYPTISLIGLTGVPHFQMGNTGPTNIAIIGGGKGGSALLSLFSHLPGVEIIGITDKDPNAPALKRANALRIPVVHDALSLIASEGTDLIVDVTSDPHMQQVIAENKSPEAEVLGGATARLLWNVVQHEAEMETHIHQNESLASLVSHGTLVNYLVKPLEDENLLASVTNAMEQRELQRI